MDVRIFLIRENPCHPCHLRSITTISQLQNLPQRHEETQKEKMIVLAFISDYPRHPCHLRSIKVAI